MPENNKTAIAEMGLGANNQWPPRSFPAPCSESKKARTAKLWKSHAKKLIQAAAIQNPLDVPSLVWGVSVLSGMQVDGNSHATSISAAGFAGH